MALWYVGLIFLTSILIIKFIWLVYNIDEIAQQQKKPIVFPLHQTDRS